MNNKDIDYIIKTAFAHEIENILEKNAQVGVLANLIKFIMSASGINHTNVELK